MMYISLYDTCIVARWIIIDIYNVLESSVNFHGIWFFMSEKESASHPLSSLSEEGSKFLTFFPMVYMPFAVDNGNPCPGAMISENHENHDKLMFI